VYVSGRLKGRSWTGTDGIDRWALEIIADDIQFLSPKAAGQLPEAA
jgi:single-stranded DNA-binding protein